MGLSREGAQETQKGDVFWNQTDQSDCDPVHCKVKEPENRKEKSKCFEIEIDGYKVTNTVNYLSESRRQKKGEKRFAMDGRRVSSLSVGSNESEGSGGTRVGQIFYIPVIFLYSCPDLFLKYPLPRNILYSCNEKKEPRLVRISSQ